jgi:hypothetical protein
MQGYKKYVHELTGLLTAILAGQEVSLDLEIPVQWPRFS